MTISINEQIMKIVYNAVGMFLLFQLIYFYESYLGWFHLPLFVLYMMTIDLYKKEYRNITHELLTLMFFVTICLSSIFIEKNTDIYTLVVNVNILILVFFCSVLICKSFRMFRTLNLRSFINDRNSRIVEKKTKFMPVFFVFAELALIFSATKVLFRISL
jgi:hypothetical protein